MVETSTTVIRTTELPAPVTASTPVRANNNAASTATATTAASARQNDEVTRGIFNLKMILFLLLLPLVLFAVFLKHLLDYLFGLGLAEKDVAGKVALVSYSHNFNMSTYHLWDAAR